MCNTISFRCQCRITEKILSMQAKFKYWRCSGLPITSPNSALICLGSQVRFLTALCLSFFTCIISELYLVTSVTSVFCSDEFICLTLGQNILKECYSDFVETLVLLFCLPVTILKSTWQLLIFWLSRHEWRMDISDQQDSLMLLSIPIMAQAERAFLILSLTPPPKG